MWTRVLRIPASSRVTAPDLVIVAWAILWIALGLAVLQNARDLANLGGTVSQTGSAINQVGGVINDIPLLPGDVGGASQSVQAAGQNAEASGTDAQAAADRLGVYLAVAIAFIPSVPIIGLYLPIRFTRIRERTVAQRALALHGGDPQYQEFLARRAVEKLPYEDIMAVSAHPWEDMQHGRFTALATAELHRLEINQRLPAVTAEPG